MIRGGTDDRSTLVVAPAWSPERFPERLVRDLVGLGHRVTVAVTEGTGRGLADVGATLLTMARPDRLGLRSVPGLARSASQAVTSMGRLRQVASRLDPSAKGRARVQAWYPLAGLVGGTWEAIYVPAEAGALPYLPLFDAAGPATVVVERPLPEKALLEVAAVVRAASPALADAAVAAGARRDRVRVVPPTVDTDFFRPAASPLAATDDGPLRIVCTTAFHWSSGHDYALVALSRLLQGRKAQGSETIQLDLVVDGADRQRLAYTLGDLGLDHVATRHHHLGAQGLRDLLAGADVFLLAAVEDRPWPELLEAMAAGLAVVATDLPAVRAMVSPDTEAVLVPPRDTDALAHALAVLADDRRAVRRLGLAARRRVAVPSEEPS